MTVNKIMAFLDACIEIFRWIRMKLKHVPQIIYNTLEELNAAKVVMEEALQLMQQKDTSDGTITQINHKLTICEIWAQRLSLTAKRAQENTKNRQFPDHLIPELDKQREELGDSVVLLSSDLRVLNL
ncbi:hypothetical protein Q9L58_001445 [Maublancomyces gigas]|uniref:Uncharacterized protein n=1 Tax=Discina gigas TaxID=1032678 RepID=A0ABR3GUM3_9PEZI